MSHRLFNWCLAVIAALTLGIVWDQPDPDPKLTAQQRAARLCGNGKLVTNQDGGYECQVRKVRGK